MLISLPAMAAKPGTEPSGPEAPTPLLVYFKVLSSNPPPECSWGSWTWGPNDGLFGVQGPAYDEFPLPTQDAAQTRILEFMIRLGGLPLTVDDFRDPTTGEFDCTNEKLYSLL